MSLKRGPPLNMDVSLCDLAATGRPETSNLQGVENSSAVGEGAANRKNAD